MSDYHGKIKETWSIQDLKPALLPVPFVFASVKNFEFLISIPATF